MSHVASLYAADCRPHRCHQDNADFTPRASPSLLQIDHKAMLYGSSKPVGAPLPVLVSEPGSASLRRCVISARAARGRPAYRCSSIAQSTWRMTSKTGLQALNWG